MKKILILAIFLFSFNSTAQFLQSRLLKVEQKNMEKFMSAVANKTKLYNSKEGQPRYITFQILTGPEAQNFVRMQYAPKVEDFDKIDKVGNAYWQKRLLLCTNLLVIEYGIEIQMLVTLLKKCPGLIIEEYCIIKLNLEWGKIFGDIEQDLLRRLRLLNGHKEFQL